MDSGEIIRRTIQAWNVNGDLTKVWNAWCDEEPPESNEAHQRLWEMYKSGELKPLTIPPRPRKK